MTESYVSYANAVVDAINGVLKQEFCRNISIDNQKEKLKHIKSNTQWS